MRYLSVGGAERFSKIGLGTSQFGSRKWGYGDDYARSVAGRVVARALELGVTLFDTAELYGHGRSERILGAALRDGLEASARDRGGIVVASKILPVCPVSVVVQQRGVASAARLGTGRIDLYQVHAPNSVVRDGTTMRGMRRLRAAGVIGDVGVSNYPLRRWRAAESALGAPVLSNQVRYSLLDRGPGDALIPYAAERGRVIIAYSPLAQGALSGRYDPDHRPTSPVRRANPHFAPENLRRAAPLLSVLREVGRAHDATPAQIALAWALHHPNVVAIPGASSVEQLEGNVAAAEIGLTDDQYAALTDAARRYQPVKVSRLAGRFGGAARETRPAS
ncbi:MAG TPA: aldo/keto reductase [Streptosporangiaceae bacterium]|jgi:aryl-alcohol dehydrogenase-like predicted oxidoreductase